MDISGIIEVITEVLKMPFSYFVLSDKRVHWLYLISSFLLALYVYWRSKQKESFIKFFFGKEMWFGRSALIDYAFIFFNSLIKIVIVAPFLVYTFYLAEGISLWFVEKYGAPELNWSATTIVIVYTLTIVVVNDFFSYITHLAMHKIPFLWQFHKVHHSATELNPFTQYRIHPIELIINNARGIVIKGVVTGVFMYYANGEVGVATFIGVNMFNFLFLFWGANLRHSHVRLKYFSFLENILISPFQHQIHHSNKPEHYDANLGSRFAFWDYFFGTLIKSEEVDEIKFGLGDREDKEYRTFAQNLLSPFYKAFRNR